MINEQHFDPMLNPVLSFKMRYLWWSAEVRTENSKK